MLAPVLVTPSPSNSNSRLRWTSQSCGEFRLLPDRFYGCLCTRTAWAWLRSVGLSESSTKKTANYPLDFPLRRLFSNIYLSGPGSDPANVRNGKRKRHLLMLNFYCGNCWRQTNDSGNEPAHGGFWQTEKESNLLKGFPNNGVNTVRIRYNRKQRK